MEQFGKGHKIWRKSLPLSLPPSWGWSSLQPAQFHTLPTFGCLPLPQKPPCCLMGIPPSSHSQHLPNSDAPLALAYPPAQHLHHQWETSYSTFVTPGTSIASVNGEIITIVLGSFSFTWTRIFTILRKQQIWLASIEGRNVALNGSLLWSSTISKWWMLSKGSYMDVRRMDNLKDADVWKNDW